MGIFFSNSTGQFAKFHS